MNRAMKRSKPARLMLPALAVMLAAGCASHYPYGGGSGVYYGKSYDRYDHHYDRYGYGYDYPYRRSSYGYSYYRYDYRHRYPVYYGGHDHGGHDDDRRGHDAGGNGNAANELRRVTHGQRRAPMEAPRGGGPIRLEREKRDTVAERAPPSGGGARDQLRRQPRPAATPAPRPATPTVSPSTRAGSDNARRDGGIRTPRDRR